jgi:hypothetical protein
MMTLRSLICLLENQNGGELQKDFFYMDEQLRIRTRTTEMTKHNKNTSFILSVHCRFLSLIINLLAN